MDKEEKGNTNPVAFGDASDSGCNCIVSSPKRLNASPAAVNISPIYEINVNSKNL